MGGYFGTATFLGDLNSNYDITQPGPALGAIGRYNFNKRTAIAITLGYGLIRADDAKSHNAYQTARNLSFQSNILDGSLVYEFNFVPFEHGSRDERFAPYIFLGLSAFYFNPKTEYQGNLVELRPLGTEGQTAGGEYASVSGSYILGGGFKIDLQSEWSIHIALASHLSWTDYIDDVSQTYPNKADLLQRNGQVAVDLSDPSINQPDFPEIGEEGRQRGNSKDNDSFHFIQIGLMKYFGKIRCPDISDGL